MNPKTRKRVSASTKTGVAFMQKFKPPYNNRTTGKTGEYGVLKAKSDKRIYKKGGEASFGGKKKNCLHCRSHRFFLRKCPQLSRKQKNEMWQHVLQQQQ